MWGMGGAVVVVLCSTHIEEEEEEEEKRVIERFQKNIIAVIILSPRVFRMYILGVRHDAWCRDNWLVLATRHDVFLNHTPNTPNNRE